MVIAAVLVLFVKDVDEEIVGSQRSAVNS
jgi:hypothetical protein